MKRHKSLILLSSDHHNGLAIAQKLKYGYKPSSSKESIPDVKEKKEMLLDFFRDHLQIHFEKEEKILAPYFTANELMDRMIEEHIRIYEMIFEIDMNKPDNDKLNEFGEMLEAHIRFEERQLFPMIEESLTEEQLEEIEKKMKS